MSTHVTMEKNMQTPSEQRQSDFADSRFENLSALIDGELSDELASLAIKQLSRDPAEQNRHLEYVAIGDAMRGLSAQHPGFNQRVMAALQAEPVVLAPLPKQRERRPVLWLAAAAAAAITWGLWQSSPREEISAPLASARQPGDQSLEAMPYLAAHQDFAQAVVSAPEMHFSKASLEIRQ